MPRFIPSDKLKMLREAAHGGDSKAKAVLMAQIDPTADFDAMFEDYFTPKDETVDTVSPEIEVEGADDNKLLAKFLSDNGVSEGDDDYDETVKMFYQEFPGNSPHCSECENPVESLENPENITTEEVCECRSIAGQLKKLIADEAEAQKGYSDALIIVANDPDLSNDEKTVLITTLKSINDDEMEHSNILLEKLKKYEKKEEKIEEVPESVI